MNFQILAMLIYLVGIVLWLLFWRVLVGFGRTRKNRLLYLPLWGCVIVLLINVGLASIAEVPDYGIEIGAGLGPFKGKAWRIGLMGSSSSVKNVTLILSALETIMRDMGHSVPSGAALSAASDALKTTEQIAAGA